MDIDDYWDAPMEPEDDFGRDDPYGCDSDGDATHWVAKVEGEYKSLKISEMTDAHLLNAIKYLERLEAARVEEAQLALGLGHDFPPESMAAYYADQESDATARCEVTEEHPAYSGLCKEARRRGLRAEL
jgi:hypothetical protein